MRCPRYGVGRSRASRKSLNRLDAQTLVPNFRRPLFLLIQHRCPNVR